MSEANPAQPIDPPDNTGAGSPASSGSTASEPDETIAIDPPENSGSAGVC